MFFEKHTDDGYSDCPFDKNFTIFKMNNIKSWELCLKNKLNQDGYPEAFGYIFQGDEGLLKNTTCLAWKINEEFRGNGIMSKFLELYLNSVEPENNTFSVVILKSNTPSQKLAMKLGFELYHEDDTKLYFKKTI